MQFFLDFIEENQLNGLFDWISRTKGHQGTVIRFSERFLTMLELSKLLPKDDIPNMFYEFSHIYPYFMRHLTDGQIFGSLNTHLNISGDISTVANMTLYELIKFKNLIPDNLDKRYFCPIEIIISIFNDVEIENFKIIQREYSSRDDFKILIERRNRNTFLSSQKPHLPLCGGISIGIDNNQFGTLGGFAKAQSGAIYGVTCSHVGHSKDENIFQPAKFDSNSHRNIGKVVYASDLNFCDIDSECSPNNSKGNMDVALIKLTDNETFDFKISQLGQVDKSIKFKDILQGKKVEFNGRTTNERKQLTVGGLCVSYKVAYDNSQYACFTNLIELRSTPTQILGTNYFINDSPVKSGDSGARICSNDSTGYSWCGMLISGDIDRGYFLSSEHILDWLDNEGFPLSM
jgi:hypothetical protein